MVLAGGPLGALPAALLVKLLNGMVDVSPKLAARVPVLSTGHGRKTDSDDAVRRHRRLQCALCGR